MNPSIRLTSRDTSFIHRFQGILGKGGLTIILMAFTLIVLVPFIWMVIMSFRNTGDILNNPFGFPQTLEFENYRKLLFDPEIGFGRYFYNSIVVSGGALLVTLILSTMGGYGFGRSRYDFKFRGWVFGLLLFALMLPPQIFFIPQFTMMSRLGLLNSYWSLILIYAATALPVSTYLMSTYFSQLPSELEDASQIDGCTHWQTFWLVMLPLARPAILTVTLMNFMNFWNELLLAITLVTDPKMRTIQAALMMFVGENGSNYAIAAASLVLSMLPTLILYLIMSDKFIEGLTAGAVKG
ncbi:MAG TPA: carbohydrate ABC transporter permease [Anaerolineales bacterium]|nr:carbohydrate ABC transporter permease [Anaerolineales bacterium]HRK89665.1 carbohydrate ABC transporter permease [Anaerolineales bacterium]